MTPAERAATVPIPLFHDAAGKVCGIDEALLRRGIAGVIEDAVFAELARAARERNDELEAAVEEFEAACGRVGPEAADSPALAAAGGA